MKANRWLAFLCSVSVLLLLFAGCASAPPVAAQPGEVEGSRIDQWVRQKMEATHVPGVAVGIVKGNEVVYLKGYGTADPSGRPVTPQTPFVLASVSKSITALAVMQLVEDGRVGLDKPVAEYLPGLALPGGAEAAITVRQLLNQTSGLSTFAGNRLNFLDSDTPLAELAAELKGFGLASRPGESFNYSNANYVLLAGLVERVTGQSYGAYVHDHIFEPLQMPDSSVELTADLKARLAAEYRPWFGFPSVLTGYEHVACLNNISTVEDMTHYLIALSNDGAYGEAVVCKPVTLEAMKQPAAPIDSGASYAMGLRVIRGRPYPLIMHPGDAPGYNANLALLPEGQWGIVVLENMNWMGMEGEMGGIIAGIEDILMGREPAAQPFHSGNLRILFDVICVVTLFFLAWSFLRLKKWRGRIAGDGRERLRRRFIPVFFLNLSLPVGMLLFLPKFFSADWAMGFRNGPDFALFMLVLCVLLLALGGFKAVYLFRRMAADARPGAVPSGQQ